MTSFKYRFVLPAAIVAAIVVATPCFAHFLWLKTIRTNDRPTAYLFFGENTSDEAYHMPEPIAKTEVFRRTADGKRTRLETKEFDDQDRVGMVAELAGEDACVLEGAQTYGVYGKSLLVYYPKHIHAASVKDFNAAGASKEQKLEIVPKWEGDELQLTVLWDGKPLPKAQVSVAVGDGEATKFETDAEGRAVAKPEGTPSPALPPRGREDGGGGTIGVLASHMDKEQSGEHDGKKYEGALHYASLTFKRPPADDSDAEDEKQSAAAKPQATIAALPEPVSSFGGVVSDGWLYVYGGHTGAEHDHSDANLSKHFRRIKLDGGAEWEELPMQTAVQGLPLVSHGGKVYRVGGLNFRNATTEQDEDMHSSAEFAVYDPASGKWEALEPMPTARSSHNAVVLGDKLYVVGGWNLTGSSPGEWQEQGLVFDLKNREAGWQQMPKQPFQRRALAASPWQGKLVAIGGMTSDEGMSQETDIFDPQTGKWSRGPEIPEKGMGGFGCSACELDGQVYLSCFRGVVYRLNEAGDAWVEVAKLETPRIFHQLLPSQGGLIAVAGANRQGHLSDIERIKVVATKSVDSAALSRN